MIFCFITGQVFIFGKPEFSFVRCGVVRLMGQSAYYQFLMTFLLVAPGLRQIGPIFSNLLNYNLATAFFAFSRL